VPLDVQGSCALRLRNSNSLAYGRAGMRSQFGLHPRLASQDVPSLAHEIEKERLVY